MSEYEDMFDEDELEELYSTEEDAMDPEDAFSMVMINRKRKVKVSVELQDKDGDVIPLRDIIEQLLSYIKEKMADPKGNQFNEQIMPLMAQSVVGGLGRMIGIKSTAFHLANEVTRSAFIQMMGMGLLLLKFVQKEELKIYTYEEPVTDEEIEKIDRKSRANSVATLASLAGADPKNVLRELRNQGHITDDDLEDILNGEGDKDDLEELKSKGPSSNNNEE